MTKEERLEFRQEIRQDIKDAVETELGAYKIPKEQHYQDHLFIVEWRRWQSSINSALWKSVIGLAITVVGTIVYYGVTAILVVKGK